MPAQATRAQAPGARLLPLQPQPRYSGGPQRESAGRPSGFPAPLPLLRAASKLTQVPAPRARPPLPSRAPPRRLSPAGAPPPTQRRQGAPHRHAGHTSPAPSWGAMSPTDTKLRPGKGSLSTGEATAHAAHLVLERIHSSPHEGPSRALQGGQNVF